MVIKTLSTYINDFLHLFFPHHCEGCGSDVVDHGHLLCLQCFSKLPETSFFNVAANPVEKIFYGRLQVQAAAAGYFFTKDSLLQHLMIELKYRNNKDIGVYLGKMIGYMLQKSNRFNAIDYLIPLPLHPRKQQKRGYNQSEQICNGIAAVWDKPVVNNAIVREQFTETQTQKNRISRWQAMQEVFALNHAGKLQNKHILLVDDIITTGATLEACGNELLKVPNLKISIATVAFTT